MKLVLLYGPPGVGKLTVARALSRLTGYKVFHNHLLIELLCSLFDWGSGPYNKLVSKYRFELLETAATNQIKGVIMTLVYGAEADATEMRELVGRMKRLGVRVFFVKVECSQTELERRIQHHSRKEFTKIRQVKDLRALLKKFDVRATISMGNNVIVNTTELSPSMTAQKIVKHFKLQVEE